MKAEEKIELTINTTKVKDIVTRIKEELKTIKIPGFMELVGVQKKGVKTIKKTEFLYKNEVLDLLECYKCNGWESSTVFYLSGAIHIKLKGKSYGVKSTIEAIAIPVGVKEPQLKHDLERLKNLK